MRRRLITPEDLPSDDGADTDEPEEKETGPLRRCAVTRERLAKEVMIRFVVGPDRILYPDLAARLPGRGIWLSARRDVLETARTRGAFAKAARGPVTVPPDLTSVLQEALARRIGEFLGLARRAGQAVCGFQKAREWLVAGRAGLVIEASDGSADERARFLGRYAETMTVVQPLDGATLGALFGRDHVVHVVVAKGRLAQMLTFETMRHAGLSQAGGASNGSPIAPETRADRRHKRSAPPGELASKVQADK
jgi:predicted RNA-binding protein YlxR (DUF448 family)/ribosomal protein L30E